MEGKIAVIGSSDFVMPYAALGADTFPVDNSAQVVEKANEIKNAKYALIVVAENVAKAAEESFASERNKPIPAIMIVPFTTGSTGIATEELSKALKMATGIDILKSS